MSQILYFESLLADIELADKIREFVLSQAEIGYSAGSNLDWKEDFAWEQAQRDFLLTGQRLSELRRTYGKFNDVIRPKRRPPKISTVQIGAMVLLDIFSGRERYLVGATSEIDGGRRERYQGRISTETPLAKNLVGKSREDCFHFRGDNYRVVDLSWGVTDYLEYYLPKYFDSAAGELRRLGKISLERVKLTSKAVGLMNLVDRFIFLEMVSDAYRIKRHFSGFSSDYERDIRNRLKNAGLSYKPFTELV